MLWEEKWKEIGKGKEAVGLGLIYDNRHANRHKTAGRTRNNLYCSGLYSIGIQGTARAHTLLVEDVQHLPDLH
jgi:hypothetical protein